MSNKKKQKESIKAKQRQMEQIKNGEYIPPVPKKDKVKEALSESKDMDPEENKRIEKSINKAIAKADTDAGVDPRMLQMFKEFKRYKVLVIAMFVLALGIMMLTMYLTDRKVINDETNTYLLIVSAIVMFGAVIIAFGRARPLREDIRAWGIINDLALKKSGGVRGASEADVDKILISRSRNKRIPPTPEFTRIRRVYLLLNAVAVVLMIVAVVIAQRNLADVTIPIIMIIVSFVLLLISLVLERVKMKPLRTAWQKEMDTRLKQVSKSKKRTR